MGWSDGDENDRDPTDRFHCYAKKIKISKAVDEISQRLGML